MSRTTTPTRTATVSIIPGDDPQGLCPTLIVDGVTMHDPQQPYRDVLPLDGCEPQVVAAFGLGLGYNAAGARLLSPGAVVVAWEPIPEMAEIARRMIAEEWNLVGAVFVETDLADFQARLLDLISGAESLATIELSPLAAAHPDWAAQFRAVIDEVVAADTLGSMVTIDGAGWAQLGRATTRLAGTPLLSSMVGSLTGHPAAIVTAVEPTAATLAALRVRQARTTLIATPPAAHALHRAGIEPDLVVVAGNEPLIPGADFSRVALAIAPEADPGWWQVQAAAQLVFGHSAAAWMLPENDPAAVISTRFGAPLALGLTALSLGARPIACPDPGAEPADAGWNLLSAHQRTARVLARCSALASATFVALDELPIGGSAAVKPSLAALVTREGRSLGAERLRLALTGARRAVGRLTREHRQFARTPLPQLLGPYLRLRAEGSLFTKAFIGPAAAANSSLETQAGQREAAFGLLDWMDEQLPPPAVSHSGTITQEIAPHSTDTLRVFIADSKGADVATRVLLWALDRFTHRRIEVRHLKHEIPARLGGRATALPPAWQALLVPTLCHHSGRAIVIDPRMVVLEDLGQLWDLRLDGQAALLAGHEGGGGLALIDAARAPWRAVDVVNRFERGDDLAALWLTPERSPGVGRLPAVWCERDRLALDTAGTQYSCEPWMPWLRELHPLTWLWEFQLVHALEDGYLSHGMLRDGVERGEIRSTLLNLAARLPDGARGAATERVAPLSARPTTSVG